MTEPIQGAVHAADIVRGVAVRAEQVFGPNFRGAFVIGSLAHGGFAPESSDIDLALVLHRVDLRTAETVAELSEWAARSFGTPLATRVSIFWCDEAHLATGRGLQMRLGAVDRADLLRSGVCVRGEDLNDRSTLPNRDELVAEAAEFSLQKFDHDYLKQSAEMLVRGGARVASKWVLFPVRLLYTLSTGDIGLNESAVKWYLARQGKSSALVELAFQWRELGVDDQQKAILALEEDGSSLYGELFAQFAVDTALNSTQRAQFLSLWHTVPHR